MQHNHRIEPPLLDGARPSKGIPSLRELDDAWEDVEPTCRRALALFPPARSDAEIEAIVDEFTEELCGAYY